MFCRLPGAAVCCVCWQVEVGVQRETRPGQWVVLVGGHPALGNWDVEKALRMTWTVGHVWKASVDLPADTWDVQYKVGSATLSAMRSYGRQQQAIKQGHCQSRLVVGMTLEYSCQK